MHLINTYIVAKNMISDSNAENAMMGFLISHTKGLKMVVNTAAGVLRISPVRLISLSVLAKPDPFSSSSSVW
mgnify:CR=1 FL=1